MKFVINRTLLIWWQKFSEISSVLLIHSLVFVHVKLTLWWKKYVTMCGEGAPILADPLKEGDDKKSSFSIAHLGLKCKFFREPSCPFGGNVNWFSHYGEQYGGALKKLKIELPYDPAIPLLDIYPAKFIIQRDTCTPVFIAALFTIARTWKQPKYPSTDEWIKMWYIYTMEYYSAIRSMK